MHIHPSRTVARRTGMLGLGAAFLFASSTAVSPSQAATPKADEGSSDEPYRGHVQVVRGEAASPRYLRGRVFEDTNRNSTLDAGEKAMPGVTVSNGRQVVKTDAQGRYRLPAFDNMTAFVTQPAGYQVPVDQHNVAQFSYNHLPEGSPDLKYGGIAPTGPLPRAVNFPLVSDPDTARNAQDCIIAGDLQTYDREEVEYARKGAIADLAARDDYGSCGALFIGDVVGDDLSLYPDVKGLTSELNGPVRFLPGNHDLDYDANLAHRFDTFREHMAPTYYSYDVGRVHVVALNTVRYPCTPEVDNADGEKPNCNDPENNPSYNGRLDAEQLRWLERDLAKVDRNKLVVLAGHIPLLTFADEGSARHQIDQVRDIYDLLKGRKAVSVAGHTHSIENMKKGDLFAGWRRIFGVKGLPFPHITAGAIAGDWYSGPLTDEGYPLAVGRDGGRPGVLTLNIDGSSFRERYTVTGEEDGVQTQLGLNTPTYREWFEERSQWNEDPSGEAPAPPPANEVTRSDLTGQTWLTTNFWMGSTGSKVRVSVDGRRFRGAVRTQQANGEAQRVGPTWSDPAATRVQLVHGGSIADRSMHLWRLELPARLREGRHTVEVRAIDSYGRAFHDEMTFRVVED